MANAIIMPRQGQSVESCIFTEWYKQVGEEITKGEPLFAYETDKASFEQEAEADGVLLAVFCVEGDEIPVLQNIGVIGVQGESVEEFREGEGEGEGEGAEAVQEEAVVVGVEEPTTVQIASATPDQKIRISPRAKVMAKKESVPFETLTGSGPEGRIIVRDIEAYLQTAAIPDLAKEVSVKQVVVEKVPPVATPPQTVAATPTTSAYGQDYEIKKMPHIRKLIAKAMHASLQNSAQLTHHLGADARRLLALRQQMKADDKAPNITINDMVCFAVIKTLKAFPDVNAHFLGEEVKYFNKVHLGLAVDTDRGLMVPVIKDADDLSITGLSNRCKDLANACRQGNIDPALLASEAASFTVSNLGNYGVEMFTPVINLPQVAILGVNTIVPRPADLGNGAYGFVPYMGLSLTYDHQALDGGLATRFLKSIADNIESLSIHY